MRVRRRRRRRRACVCSGSVCVCFCSQGGVCIPPFFALTHTPTPLLRQDQRRRGFTRWWPSVVAEKDCSENRVHMCVCLRNVKMSFSQHQRPAHHREVERGVFSFQVENRERRGITFFVCDPSLLHFTAYVFIKLIPLHIRETRENGCNQMCK